MREICVGKDILEWFKICEDYRDEFSGQLIWSKTVKVGKRLIADTEIGKFKLGATSDNPEADIKVTCASSGWVHSILVKSGSSISSTDYGKPLLILSDENPCEHAISVAGLCAECGEQLPTVLRLSSMINLGVTNQVGVDIAVSEEYAEGMSTNKLNTLLRDRKLILVLDLYNTFIHCSESKPPPDMIYEDARESMVSFESETTRIKQGRRQLLKVAVIDTSLFTEETGKVLSHDFEEKVWCHYVPDAETDERTAHMIQNLESNVFYIQTPIHICYDYGGRQSARVLSHSHFKIRPGALQFLRECSELYELVLYTAGTQEHAESGLKLLDPERRFFGDRVLARSALINGKKSLVKVLPSFHHAIIVVDDMLEAWSGDATAVFTCYPYFWHFDPMFHFCFGKQENCASLKLRAVCKSLCQYSAHLIRSLRMGRAITQTLGIESHPTAREIIASEITHQFEGELLRNSPALSENSNDDCMTEVPRGDVVDELKLVWQSSNLKASTGTDIPQILQDNDAQLHSLRSILATMRYIFYSMIDLQKEEESILIPACLDIMSSMRRAVMKKMILLYCGPVFFKFTDVYRNCLDGGVEFIFTDEVRQPDYIIIEPGESVPEGAQVPVVTKYWLECILCTLTRPPVELFDPEKSSQIREFWDLTCVDEDVTDDGDDEELRPRKQRRRLPSALRDNKRWRVTWDDPKKWIDEYGYDIEKEFEQLSSVNGLKNIVMSNGDVFQENPKDLEEDLLEGLNVVIDHRLLPRAPS